MDRDDHDRESNYSSAEQDSLDGSGEQPADEQNAPGEDHRSPPAASRNGSRTYHINRKPPQALVIHCGRSTWGASVLLTPHVLLSVLPLVLSPVGWV